MPESKNPDSKVLTELYQAIVESSEDFIFALDTRGRLLFINPFGALRYGQPAEKLVGQDLSELFSPKVAERQKRNIDQVVATGDTMEVEGMTTIGHRDFCLHTRLTPMKDEAGKVRVVVGISRDITERKKTLEGLADSEARYRTMFESSLLAMVIHERGTVIDANESAAGLFGYTREEMIGSHASQYVPQDSQHLLSERLGDDTESIYEIEGQRKDGSRLDMEVQAVDIRHCDRKARMAVFRDLTEIRHLQAEALRAQKLESLGTLAGGIAHDFNNLLMAFQGNVTLAGNLLKHDHPAAERLNEAEKALVRATNLTQQLLTFSRGGQPVLLTAPIGNFVRQAADFALRGSNMTSEIRIDDDLWPVASDPGQISQVVQNLVLNASQAMPDGGTIRIRCDNIEPDSDSAVPGGQGYVRVTVADSGDGISPENQARIFDPYFSTRPHGTGLGLATAYSIVAKHGGLIMVSSRIGEGATFNVYLPASDSPPDTPVEKPVGPLTGKGQILIMDDDPGIRDVLNRMLVLLGYTVVETREGGETLTSYRKSRNAGMPFDAVIMDMTVRGGMGGKEATRQLLDFDPGARVIVSSGYSTDPVMAEFRDLGFQGVLRKPYQLEDLGSLLSRVLGD